MIRINLRYSFGLFWMAWALAVVLIFIFGSAVRGAEGTVSKETAAMEHMSKDRLVLWGWDPGPDRTKPPVSHEEFVAGFSKWVAAGLPCP